ncbi:MFS transporter [Streptacidiphilus sp. P02-A3a]|uniref:MFS transporter n=1 Tax=Streptacidiphilus sp. P02-A3a TaxID=2704468 RepID=UPI0015F9A7EA|nr:MFS transporter [Streptacidiphilus sp. P02-A3a]QMU70372.1 MFS transporter [Streptacidiphilus sp. P02-A3a]
MRNHWAVGSYLAGATAARAGDEMAGPALALAALAATGSASRASALSGGLMVAAAVGGPVFGALLDRSAAPGRLLAAALAGYAAALALVLAALGRLPFAGTVSIAVGGGLLGPAMAGGWTSQLPRVVADAGPRGGLARANALDAMTFDGAALLGPALAGTVAALAGARAAVSLSLALICLAVPVAWALPGPPSSRGRPGARDLPRTALLADLGTGLRAIVRTGPLARATAVSVLSCVGEGMLTLCCPLLGRQVLGGTGRGTLLLSATAASGLAANALLSRRPRAAPGAPSRPDGIRPDTVLWCGTVVLAGAMALAATRGPLPVVVAALVAGLGGGPQLTALFAIRHREAPARVRGQVFTTGASLKTTGFAIGAGVAGPIATWSLSGALLVAAGVELLAALVYAALTRVAVGPAAPAPGRR